MRSWTAATRVFGLVATMESRSFMYAAASKNALALGG